MNTQRSRKRGRFIWLIFPLALVMGLVGYVGLNLDTWLGRERPRLAPPEVISRDQWGARPLDLEARQEYGLFDAFTNPEGVLYYQDELDAVLTTIVVHHSAYPNAGPTEIQELHMDKRGFADIGYHYMIDSDGNVFEGRPINIRGAHVQGYNTGSVGVVLLGNFNEDLPSGKQLVHLRLLVDYLRYEYDIQYLAGHRDYPDQSPDGTECPGDNLYPLLPGLARDLGMKFGIAGYISPEWVP